MSLHTLPKIPWSIGVGFTAFVLLLVALILVALYRVHGNKRVILLTGVGFLAYLGITGTLALTGFYADFAAVPPRFMFGVLPAVIAVLVLVSYRETRRFLMAIPVPQVIGWQAFRIGVEILLLTLYRQGIVPRAMTWEGSNFDIVTGLTALPVAYLLAKGILPRKLAIAWNILGLLLLANVVRIAALAAPSPFHQATNDVPNLAIALFPFIWLPYLLVPLALLSHLLSLRQLWQKERQGNPAPVQQQFVTE